MFARHMSRKALLFQLCCSRRYCSFKGALQATSSLYQTELGVADGMRSSSKFVNLYCGPRRFFATRSAADGYLLELLKSEIDENKQKVHSQTKEEAMVGPFVLLDKPGTEEVVLSRTMGSEKVEILCMLEKQYPEDEDEVQEQKLQHRRFHHYNEQKHVMHEEDLEVVEVLHMSVNLSRGSDSGVHLEVDCSFVYGASEVMIEDVLFHESDPALSSDGPEPYGGPIFEDLDERLQEAFLGLLKARGLTTKVARYMMEYMSGKERREYVGWLCRLHDFLAC